MRSPGRAGQKPVRLQTVLERMIRIVVQEASWILLETLAILGTVAVVITAPCQKIPLAGVPGCQAN